MKLKNILLEAEAEQAQAILDKEFGEALKDIMSSANSSKAELSGEANDVNVNESLGALTIVSILIAMPKAIELLAKPIGKFIKLSKKVFKPGVVQDEEKVAEMILHFAHKWHSGYVTAIKWILQVTGAFKKAGITTDAEKNKAADLIYYIIIAALAVYSGVQTIKAFSSVASAATAGTISLAGLETALASIKAHEVATFVKKLAA